MADFSYLILKLLQNLWNILVTFSTLNITAILTQFS